MKQAKTIDDFDNLVDLRTLARHCLYPETSAFVLWAIAIEEKNEYYHISSSSLFLSLFFFLSVFLLFYCRDDEKFNQDMYVKMRAKKNEPLSTLRKKGVRVVDQGLPVVPATNVIILMRVASSATLVEEITPLKKKA